jgi:hypothetical protein
MSLAGPDVPAAVKPVPVPLLRRGIELRDGLALAWAFLRGNRDLLILDEASSGLDGVAGYEVHIRLRDTASATPVC